MIVVPLDDVPTIHRTGILRTPGAHPGGLALLAAMFSRLRETSVAMPPGEPGRPTLRAWLVELMLAVLPLDDARRALQGLTSQQLYDPIPAEEVRALLDELVAALLPGVDGPG